MQNNVNRWCKPASHVVDISILGHIQVDIGTIMWIIGVIVEQTSTSVMIIIKATDAAILT